VAKMGASDKAEVMEIGLSRSERLVKRSRWLIMFTEHPESRRQL
jgi:hypothetical protein